MYTDRVKASRGRAAIRPSNFLNKRRGSRGPPAKVCFFSCKVLRGLLRWPSEHIDGRQLKGRSHTDATSPRREVVKVGPASRFIRGHPAKANTDAGRE